MQEVNGCRGGRRGGREASMRDEILFDSEAKDCLGGGPGAAFPNHSP